MARAVGAGVSLFVYGSLVDPASAEATLGRPLLAGDAPAPAELSGFRRAWNTATGAHSHPDRRFLLPDGTPFGGVLAVLGLEPDAGARCTGAVVRVSPTDLARLVARERNYDLADVTGQVRAAGDEPVDGTVLTFVPRRASTALLLVAVSAGVGAGVGAAIRGGYLRTVERGFGRLGGGRLSDFRATTTPSDLPVLEVLEVRTVSGPGG